ncbi:hypothetical protein NA57DRAFT_82225 [Rhizodiscina lignyota]|uniref:SRR1-like domain-containing protein n=1 Tax=Rhizodiscina lignyota TaxID=1504668 RepID=A0A9P4I4W9_9PEZI|nr:hypothetical protein NA57DRAFT_82225 [Rhizodiscina lignyota]
MSTHRSSPTTSNPDYFRIEDDWEWDPSVEKDLSDNAFEEIRKYVQSAREMYDSGKPLFPRSVILDAAQQLKAKSDKIFLRGWDGQVKEYPYYRARGEETLIPILHFGAFENRIKFAYIAGSTYNPLSICWTNGFAQHPRHTLEQITDKFKMHEKSWREGDICPLITESICKMDPVPTKVIGLGLGTPDQCDGKGPFFQHAAIVTIAEVLKEKGGREAACMSFCQDPAYSSTDKELLEDLNVTVLESPMGFLEIDSNSIVVSISPNVPVKQIVADDRSHWPAMMIWARIDSTEQEKEMYSPRHAL